ncbi:MAG: retropepsin-like domain-containing protein [Bdellovibrionales bacterium]|nr:retropepsin-like domain-containing protein [Bdellovibrionales bacterium]
MKMLLPLIFLSVSSWAQAPAQTPGVAQQSLTLVANQKESPEALNLSLLRKLAPKLSNPHRQFWWVSRDVRYEKVVAQVHDGGFRPLIKNVLAPTTVYLRAPGNWESDWKEFTCSPDADPYFSNWMGSKIAAVYASELWVSLLTSKLPLLKILVSKIHTPTAVQAEKAAWAVLERWKADLENEFKVKSQLESRGKEWSYYRTEAQKKEICMGDRPVETPAPRKTWRERMETVDASRKPKLLSRSPAERIGGLYVVRLSMKSKDKILNGQFIVDSASGASLISPAFLERQGVKVSDVEVKDAPLQRVRGIMGESMARMIRVNDPKLSSHALETKNFLLVETQLFRPPEYRTYCCDGVLGSDFLEKYAVEFLAHPRPTVLLWEREGYVKKDIKGNIEPWVEVFRHPDGDLVSEGVLEWDGKKDAIAGIGLMEGKKVSGTVHFRWDTGNDTAALMHEPWSGPAAVEGSDWSLTTDKFYIARDFEMDFHRSFMNRQTANPKIASVTLNLDPFTKKDPAFTVGMRMLDRSSFVLDLANGRIWLSQDALARPVIENRTGVELRYVYNAEDDRELRVVKIKKESALSFLKTYGFGEGTLITEIAGKGSNYWNQGEVNRFLSERPGTKLAFKWKTQEGVIRDAEITLP